LGKFLVSFYTEQAAGVYDPRRKTMLIADWVGEDMQKMVLAHELTHALQDQNFDLEKFLHAVRDDDDSTSARQAIVEGHATAAMMQEMIKPASLTTMPSLQPLMGMMIQRPMAQFPAFSGAPFFFRPSARRVDRSEPGLFAPAEHDQGDLRAGHLLGPNGRGGPDAR
ncbi:MAG: hypothetical protein DMG26_13760, partial [Acidobacteria bacterium]